MRRPVCFRLQNLKEEDCLEELGIDYRILKWILKK
jgi:hypothetical protein